MEIRFKNRRELICLSLWCVFSFFYILNSSLLPVGMVFKALQLGTMEALGVVFLTSDHVKLKKVIFVILLTLCSLIMLKNGGKKIYLVYVFFLLNHEHIKFDKLVRCTIASVLVSTLFVIGLSQIGVVEDFIFIRETGEKAHSLGFLYYYNASAQIMFVSIMYLYVKEKVSWAMLGVIAGVSYLFFKICTTRLPFYMMLIVLVMYVLIYKLNLIKSLNHLPIKCYSVIAFPVMTVLCVFAALNYNPQNKTHLMANDILNGRLRLSKQAFDVYGIKLLGQKVEMQGRTYGQVQNFYFFIDSGYILSVVEYGLIFTIILSFLYSILYLYACRENDKKLFIWITMILGFNVVNGCWFAIMYNPILYMLFHMEKDRIYDFMCSSKLNKVFHYRRER